MKDLLDIIIYLFQHINGDKHQILKSETEKQKYNEIVTDK